jgi:leader peptidase (prepilin peptidase)/N-methyltransferase
VSTALAIVVAFVLGLVVGSFLNVVLWRVPRGESIVTPGSHCTECGTPLRARELVPVVSWVAQRGRCRNCGAGISVRYPLVELATGLVFGAVTALVVG